MCLFGSLIRNPKYKVNKKNGGNVPVLHDKRIEYVPIGCGDCIECRKQKARNWQIRLLEDIKTHKNGKFITLTLSNESVEKISNKIWAKDKQEKTQGYELDNQIAKYALRHFLERYRKETEKSIRHLIITELGHNGTENIHMHGILWTNEPRTTILKHWQYGYIFPRTDKEWKNNYVNERTVNYIMKYITKTDKEHRLYKSIILETSGIGNNYTKKNWNSKSNKFNGENTNETYKTRTGHKISLPIYYRNKIYSEEEREKLWLQKLDKQERWVLGEKVDISKGDKEYYQLLKQAQEKNKRLGYGNGEKTWEQEQYERERRILKQEERLSRNRGNMDE